MASDPFLVLLAREMQITPEDAEVVMEAYSKAVRESLARCIPVIFEEFGRLNPVLVGPVSGTCNLPAVRGKPFRTGGCLRVNFRAKPGLPSRLYRMSPRSELYSKARCKGGGRELCRDTGELSGD